MLTGPNPFHVILMMSLLLDYIAEGVVIEELVYTSVTVTSKNCSQLGSKTRFESPQYDDLTVSPVRRLITIITENLKHKSS